MELFVNDLSLHGQFPTPTTFRQALNELLNCRGCAQGFNRMCYVPRSIPRRSVTPTLSFRQAITSMGDMNVTRLVMAWIDRQGPFADDDLIRNPDEYYTLENSEDPVTEEILGEVAARHFAERPAALVSFAPSNFTLSPLTLVWHRSDKERENGYIDNFWALSELRPFLEGLEEGVASWTEMLARAQARYTNLTFLEGVEQHLAGEPFSSTIARRALELLDILNQIKGSYTAIGQRSEEGEQLIDNYFRRTNSFSDASDTEKNTAAYRAAMTFRLPDNTPLECFWHGKISRRYFRIHFSPIEADKPLYIAYIGPKRTKQ